MKRNLLRSIVLLTLCLALVLALAACKGKNKDKDTGKNPGGNPVTPPTCSHTPGAITTEKYNPPSCTAPGSFDMVSYCTKCNAEMSRVQNPLPATGHVYVDYVCTVCGTSMPTSTGLEFTSNGDGTCYVDDIGDCTDTEIVIPALSPAGDRVIAIGDNAFYGADITAVTIPSGVQVIGEDAFSSCERLSSVVIPDGVTVIGDDAFYDCNGLVSVTVGSGVTSIGDTAFSGCDKLAEVINKSALDIVAGSLSFGHIGYYALEVHSGDSKIVNADGYLFYTLDGYNYLLGYVGEDDILVLPEHYNEESYEIYRAAFMGSDISSVTVPMAVTAIGEHAFSLCHRLIEVINRSALDITAGSTTHGRIALNALSVHNGESGIKRDGDYLYYTSDEGNYLIGYLGEETALTLPEYFEGRPYEIYTMAFAHLTELTSVVIPEGVTAIGESAFAYCTALTSVVMSKDLCSIGDYAFFGCTSLMSVTVGDGTTSIGYDAFDGCNRLIEVINKSGLYITAGSSDHGSIALNALEVHGGPSKLGAIGGFVFYTLEGEHYLVGCTMRGNIGELALPESYGGASYRIYDRAFSGLTGITSVVIPEAVYAIGGFAFSGCVSLESIRIPNHVSYVGMDAFNHCSAVTIYCDAVTEPVGWDTNWNNWGCPVVWGYTDESYEYVFVTGEGDYIEPVTSDRAFTLPIPTRSGYVFLGWYDNSEFAGSPVGSTYSSKTNHTLYAKWGTADGSSFDAAITMSYNTYHAVNIVTGGQRVYLKFTATTSGTYYFISNSSYDTYGYLYNEVFYEITHDDDTGADNNFKMSRYMNAGETVYLVAKMWASDTTGSYSVRVYR